MEEKGLIELMLGSTLVKTTAAPAPAATATPVSRPNLQNYTIDPVRLERLEEMYGAEFKPDEFDPVLYAMYYADDDNTALPDRTSIQRVLVLYYHIFLKYTDINADTYAWFVKGMVGLDGRSVASTLERTLRLASKLYRLGSNDIKPFAPTLLNILNDIEFRVKIDEAVRAYQSTGAAGLNKLMDVFGLDVGGNVVPTRVALSVYQSQLKPVFTPLVVHTRWLCDNLKFAEYRPDDPGVLWITARKAADLVRAMNTAEKPASERLDAFLSLKQFSFDADHVLAMCGVLEQANVFCVMGHIVRLRTEWLYQLYAERSPDYIKNEIDAKMSSEVGEGIEQFLTWYYAETITLSSRWTADTQTFLSDMRTATGEEPLTALRRKFLADYILIGVESSDEKERRASKLKFGALSPSSLREIQEGLWKRLPTTKYARLRKYPGYITDELQRLKQNVLIDGRR